MTSLFFLQNGVASALRLRPVWMTNHPPSVLWHCWFGHHTCKNRRPYNLYCIGADVKPCSINQSMQVHRPRVSSRRVLPPGEYDRRVMSPVAELL